MILLIKGILYEKKRADSNFFRSYYFPVTYKHFKIISYSGVPCDFVPDNEFHPVIHMLVQCAFFMIM